MPSPPLVVLVNTELPTSVLTRIRDISPRLTVVTPAELAARPEWLTEAEILHTHHMAADKIASARQVKWVQTLGAGVEWLLTPEVRRREACPFAHRTRLVLAEKRLSFELVEIDLQNKPAWFNTVSSYGKVPALQRGAERVVESVIVNEYLDEAFPEPALLPKTPGARATARIWIDYATARFVPAWGTLLRCKTDADRESARGGLMVAKRGRISAQPSAAQCACKLSVTTESSARSALSVSTY